MRTELGFANARVTPGGADGGIDVAAPGVAAQVKHYASPVGAPEIQQARGAAYALRYVLFYALSGYTPAAVAAANNAEVCLFTYSVYGDVVAINFAAKQVMKAREAESTRPRSAREKAEAEAEAVAKVERERRRQARLADDRSRTSQESTRREVWRNHQREESEAAARAAEDAQRRESEAAAQAAEDAQHHQVIEQQIESQQRPQGRRSKGLWPGARHR